MQKKGTKKNRLIQATRYKDREKNEKHTQKKDKQEGHIKCAEFQVLCEKKAVESQP